MNTREKLEYVLEYHDAEELLKDLFDNYNSVDLEDWLNDVYRGSPEPEEDDESLTPYQRNEGWRNW